MKRFAATLLAVSCSATLASAQAVDLTTTNGGFTQTSLQGSNLWQWANGVGWFVNGSEVVSHQRLLSPVLTATGTSWGFSFVHANSFEIAGFDGGNLKVSINGGAFTVVGANGNPYNCLISDGFSNPLGAQLGFCDINASRTSTVSGASNIGDIFQFAFDGGWDSSLQAENPNWLITSVTYRDFTVGISTVPEPSTWVLTFAGLAVIAFAARNRRA